MATETPWSSLKNITSENLFGVEMKVRSMVSQWLCLCGIVMNMLYKKEESMLFIPMYVCFQALDAKSAKELEVVLKGFLKKGESLLVETRVDPALIGGMQVTTDR